MNKGNVQVVRRPGRRPYRVHRACPKKPPATAGTVAKANPFAGTQFRQIIRNAPSKRSGGQGTVLTVEGVIDYPEPVSYRYFITRATAERLKKAITGKIRNFSGVGITVEVIPVPDFQVEADPDTFAELVEMDLSKWIY